MRAAFEKYGSPLPGGEGLYLWLPVAPNARVHLATISGEGEHRRMYVEASNPCLVLPGLYLPLARLFAAVEVAEASLLGNWTAELSAARTTYRSTR